MAKGDQEGEHFAVVLDRLIRQIYSVTHRLECLRNPVNGFWPAARSLSAALREMERLLPRDEAEDDDAEDAVHKAGMVRIAAQRVIRERGHDYEADVRVVLASHPELKDAYAYGLATDPCTVLDLLRADIDEAGPRHFWIPSRPSRDRG